MQILLKLDKGITKLSQILSFIGAILIVCSMVLIVYNVLVRALFDSPFEGTAEIVKNSIVLTAFFMIPWAMVEKRHVRSTIITDRVPPLGKKILDITAYTVGAVVFLLTIYASWDLLVNSIVTMEYEYGTINIPMYPLRISIVLGCILTCWHCIMEIIHIATNEKYLKNSKLVLVSTDDGKGE